MRRAKLVAPVVATLLVLAALPLIGIQRRPELARAACRRGFRRCAGSRSSRRGRQPTRLDPTTIIVDAARAHGARPTAPSIARSTGCCAPTREVAGVSAAVRATRAAATCASTSSAGTTRRARRRSPSPSASATALIPAAALPRLRRPCSPAAARAYAADFVSRTLGSFPWLILGVLGLTYLLLVRAFRSLLLPLKAIVLNLLTVAAASGLMIAVLPVGLGELGRACCRSPQIEGWIPVFMFTLLFGLSMDYEVFLVTRMREAWDSTRSNTRRGRRTASRTRAGSSPPPG